MRELILVRHGQSLYNVRLTDHLDSGLTEEGVRQVRETGQFLRTHLGHLHEFVGRCSPYLRCLQTARILSEETGIEFWVDDGPREVMIRHDWCQVPSRRAEYPEFDWNRFQNMREYVQEDEDTFNNRMKHYLQRLQEEDKVLVVSHGTPVTALFLMSVGEYQGPGLFDGQYVDNSSLSYLRNGERIWFNKVVYGGQAPTVDRPGDSDLEV